MSLSKQHLCESLFGIGLTGSAVERRVDDNDKADDDHNDELLMIMGSTCGSPFSVCVGSQMVACL